MKKKSLTKSDRTRIITLHNKGYDSKRIRKELRHLSPMQIAAVKAHCKMGTYDEEDR